jgi:hypothetical protein
MWYKYVFFESLNLVTKPTHNLTPCGFFAFQFIEKALEECENDLDSAIKCLLPLHSEPTEFNVDPVYQSPSEMSTEVQVSNEGNLPLYSMILAVMFTLCYRKPCSIDK